MECAHVFELRSYCGAKVCIDCDHHDGMVRCYCGWSIHGGDGRAELIEFGENLEEDW